MKPTVAANVALALAPAGWFALAYAVLGSLGDYPPRTSESAMHWNQRISFVSGFLGAALLVTSMALAGFGFSTAQRRAILAILMFVIPFLVLFAYAMQQ